MQECWQAKIRELEARQGTVTQQEAQELARKLAWMKETEMAVVISQEQNEVQTFKKWGWIFCRTVPKWKSGSWIKNSRTARIRSGWCSSVPCG
ncbi:MAG: hypothetical protein ACLS4R_11260 [Roseburia inulinivorans]